MNYIPQEQLNEMLKYEPIIMEQQEMPKPLHVPLRIYTDRLDALLFGIFFVLGMIAGIALSLLLWWPK